MRDKENLIVKAANQIQQGHLKFASSEYNSAENLTKPSTTDAIFSETSI